MSEKPRDSWSDHPPEDFAWTRVLAIIGGFTVALLVALVAVWLLFR